MGIVCGVEGIWYTLRRWWNVGIDGIVVSGHHFVDEGKRSVSTVEEGGVRFPVEWQLLTCERCGHESGGWHPLYGNPRVEVGDASRE